MRISKDICIIWSCDVLVCATWHQWNKDTFFGDHSLEHGVFLKQGETLVPFHAKLGILIADEVALKQSIEAKGAAGKVLCMRCQNTLSKSAWTPTLGRAGFVSSTCIDINKFRLHTNESVQKIVEHLRQSHDEMPQLQFQKLETSLGFNWKEDGILAHPVYGKEIPEIIMYDWFHIFLVHGVANRELGLLAGHLRKVKVYEESLDEFISSFTVPKQFAGAAPKKIFGKRIYKFDPINCSASELATAYPLIRGFILGFLWHDHEGLRPQLVSALKLMECLDLLMSLNRGGNVAADELHSSLVGWLQAHLDAYGDENWVPKHHCSLHLNEFLKRHGCLLSCWVHERKHRLVKRFGDHVMDFNKGFEKSILSDIIHVQCDQLEEELFQDGVSLIGEKRAREEAILWLRGILGPGEIFTSFVAQGSCGQRIHKGDVVFFEDRNNHRVGKILSHLRKDQVFLTVLEPWHHVHDHMYRVALDPVVIKTSSVGSLCLYSCKDGNAMVFKA